MDEPIIVPKEGLPAEEMAKLVEPAPEPKQPTAEEINTRMSAFREQIWAQTVNPFREAIAKRRGIALEDVELEGDRYILKATDAEGNVAEGVGYRKLAFAANGLYAMPKGHGRRKPRIGARRGLVKIKAQEIFVDLFQAACDKAKASLKEGEEFKGLTASDVKDLTAIAAVRASRLFRAAEKAPRRERRNMQRISRRVNFGLLAGNRARLTLGL